MMEIKICYDEGRTYPYRLFIEIGEYIFMTVTEFATEEDAKKAAVKIAEDPSLLDLPFEMEWIPLVKEEGKIVNHLDYERNDF